MNDCSNKEDLLQREEVRKALWNTVLPTTREVDPVLWDSVVEVIEEEIVNYLKLCPRQEAKIAELAANVVTKEGPPASLEQVIRYLVDTKVLVPVESFRLEKVAVRDSSANLFQSILSSTASYSFELLKQTFKPVLERWTGLGDNNPSVVLTHKHLVEDLVKRLWTFVEDQQETHIGGRFLVQELCSVFSGDEILCHRALCSLVERGKAVVYEIERNIFGVKFGPDRSISESDKNIFSVMNQIAKLEKHIDSLNSKLSKIEKSLKACAKRMIAFKQKSSESEQYATERKRGIQLLRIFKYLESSIDRSYKQLSNLNEMLYSSEAAELSQQAAQALKFGRDAMLSLKQDQAFDISRIDDVMLDLQEQIESQQEIDDIVTSPIMSNSDLSSRELEEDLNRWEASLVEENDSQEQKKISKPNRNVVVNSSELPSSQEEVSKAERKQGSSTYAVPLNS